MAAVKVREQVQCPACGCRRSRVIKAVWRVRTGITWRRRECKNEKCLARFGTESKPETVVCRLKRGKVQPRPQDVV